MKNRDEQITERLGEMPRKYRKTYRRATEGKSLRACINAQCLECCVWQSREVATCTARACPLWAVRPHRHDSGNGRDGDFSVPESMNDKGGR